ncbi:MAG: phosphatidate cytidylyltransferase [Myxococcaceae bacterium]
MNPDANFMTRVVSALVLLPVVLGLIVMGGLPFAALFALAGAVCAGEYYAITLGRVTLSTWPGLVLAAALSAWPALCSSRPGEPDQVGQAALGIAGAALLFSWLEPLLKRGTEKPAERSAHLFKGVLYGGLGLFALVAVRMGENGLGWLIAALVVTWANDTLAYFAGRIFGRHKLYPEVSPNKTWEGFVGGMLGSVGGLFALRAVYFPVLTPQDCVAFGVLAGVMGPLGDFSESMLKRSYGVKDSSQLIPGHGGLLDRIDALLFNGLAVYAYVFWLRAWWMA